MQRLILAAAFVLLGWSAASAQSPTQCTLISPNGGETFRPGTSQDLRWDTTGTSRARWRFLFGTSPAGPWTQLVRADNVLDSGSTRGAFAGGLRVPAVATTSGYIRMELISDPNVFDISDNPFTIIQPQTIVPDSIIKGEITGTVHLHRNKIYGLQGYVYVNDGGKLVIDPGTIIVGDTPGNNSALIVNRGGKLVAEGTKTSPIIFTSRAAPGQRARGDWGGVLICGKARTNHPAGQAALEGGVADANPGKGWFGGTDDDDSSGILKYVRIEFAGIATQPNSELNGLTLGGVGRRTVLDYIQVSFANDDAFEWFGGSVNARHLVAIGTLDDDFDGDNGWSGKVQFAVAQRYRTVADVSTSQSFEIDNDATGSFNSPKTSVVFSNVTSIGPIQDTSWTPGNGPNQYSSRFGAAAQIRRNARASIFNSIFLGWPRGIEIAQVPTMVVAFNDTLSLRQNSWFGIKGTWLNLAGGTPPAGMDATWIAKAGFNNTIDKANPHAAFLENPFATDVTFSPRPLPVATFLTTASFTNTANGVPIDDPFFERVAYRGAFSPTDARWDEGWTNYDPVNTEYRAQPLVHILTPGAAAGETYVQGAKVDITWDTTGGAGNTFTFEFGTTPAGPWTAIAGAENVTDAGATRGKLAQGFTVPSLLTTTGYIRMSLVSDNTIFDVSDVPFTIISGVVDPVVRLLEPGTSNKTFRVGQSVDVRWDTTGTYRKHFKFEFGKSQDGPWAALPGLSNVLDSAARRGAFAGGIVFRPADVTTTGYIKMTMVEDPTKFDINDQPFTITAPEPVTCDSMLTGEINSRVKLHNTKVYCIDGYVYVNDGAELEIEPGTIILGGVPGTNSALIVNRGGKLIAEGKANLPIIFSSRAVPGQRSRGDWGGVLLCGKARTNHPAGQAALEGGVADANPGKGWFGGTDDEDSSGILKYVRIEFAGIATQPNSELNGLTLGGVGRGTVLEYIQVSHANDDAFEWFGGSVNARHLIATGALDDDFDGDNGWRGKVQFALGQRFRTIADVSTSQTFEMDNDATASTNQPLTSPVFSNVTSIGPIQDTAWTPGNGANQYSSRFGAAAQIRRNARTSIHNTIFLGWPRGIEIAQVNTMVAALNDSVQVRNNSWYGVKGTWLNLAGGTAPAGMDANWIAKAEFGNVIDKSSPNVAKLENPFATNVEFNPVPASGSPVLSGAAFTGNADDSYFERVTYRGAFGMQRWDLPWSEYDPVNREYKAQPAVSVEEENPQAVAITGRAFPNPASDASTIRYELSRADVVTIRVVDALGALASTFIANEQQGAGTYEFRLVTSDLANGVYYVTINGQHGTITIPVNVVR